MQLTQRLLKLKAEALDFAPAVVRIQEKPPSPLPRVMLHATLALFATLVVWAIFGRLDIIAVAQGKLVPQSYLQIVQPADAGIVKELLVKQGDAVKAGQVLVRMDTSISDAERTTLTDEMQLKSLQLRRIDAELAATPPQRSKEDPPELFAQVAAQYRQRRQAYLDALAEQQAALTKAREDLANAQAVKASLEQTLPVLIAQDEGWEQLAKEGFAGKLMAMDKKRARMEKEGELRAQTYTVASLQAAIAQAEQRSAQITSNYRSQLLNERVEAEGEYRKLTQDWAKQQHREGLLELRAPQDGLVKDLSTHTVGTVVQPGTVLMTVVPVDDAMVAEVWVSNLDAGSVGAGQPVKVKLTAYPFQRYGMIEGVVEQVSPDASELPAAQNENKRDAAQPGTPLGYRALVALKTPYLERDGVRHSLSSGMQVTAEINLGSRTVLEYLLSPVRKTLQEAGRER
jgi:membrane fusion protein, hemolysin D